MNSICFCGKPIVRSGEDWKCAVGHVAASAAGTPPEATVEEIPEVKPDVDAAPKTPRSAHTAKPATSEPHAEPGKPESFSERLASFGAWASQTEDGKRYVGQTVNILAAILGVNGD